MSVPEVAMAPNPLTGPEPPLGIAVFGGSEAEPGQTVYRTAQRLGELIAQSGVPVVNGGYGGVMEAASRGAREQGGEVVGVTCRAFAARGANPWLTLEIEEPDLFARTARLVALSRGFVVLEGASGTLAELAMLWALARAGALDAPIVLLDPAWDELTTFLRSRGRLDRACQRVTRSVESPEQAVRAALGEEREAPE
jgi:hypothetical protein